MNRNDFIAAILERHNANMTTSNLKTLKEDYETVLPNNVDFDDLFTQYLNEYTMQRHPAPAWFAQRLKYKEYEYKKDEQIKSVYAVINGHKYEFGYTAPTTEEQAKNAIKARKGIKTIEFITQKEFRGY